MRNPRLKPLSERLTPAQQDNRNRKIAARRIVAAQLQGQINLVGAHLIKFVRMGFFRRVWWLLTGRV